MSEEYAYYSAPQYLGKSGVTQPCMLAMAAILTGAFRPEKITAVVGVRDSGPDRVLFLVWNWFYPGLTIIADGFGTHGSEGGTGFSTVLGLIKFYEIPLLQTRIVDYKAFSELAHGTLTEETFAEIQEAREYRWDSHAVAAIRKVKKGQQYVLEAIRADGATLHTFRLP